ncbi:MAG: response regulator [Rubrivivax sp.]
MRWPWLSLIAVVCGAALLGVVLLQVQQLQRLSAVLADRSELRVVSMHRQEVEFLQLRDEWVRATDASRTLDLRALTLRYDIWVGRAAMLREDTAMRRTTLAALPQLDETLARINAFIAAADRSFAQDLDAAQRRAALARLLPDLDDLSDPIHQLSLDAAHRANEEETARHLLLHQHSRFTLGLTGFMALLVLAFATLALRQMRQLRRRHRVLEALTVDLHAARRAAEASSQAKSQFLANMSHEIRTPFQGLLGMLSLLRDSGLNAHQIDYLRTATESADHLLTVLNDILDMSQLEAGRLMLHATPVVLRELLADVETLMRGQAHERGLALRVEAEPSVPDCARLDSTRVKQVLFNLLSNAIKFSPRGSVDVDLRNLVSADGSRQLCFVVSDTGPGMDAELMARLFQRFERGASGVPGTPGGSGLGLAISRSLARLMGGELTVTSQPGEGSRFTFVVPFEPVPATETPVAAREATPPPAQPLDILVAEDHAVNRQVLAALLDSMGHRALFVPSGDEALATVQRQRFDLVLMDLHMPGLDGIEATRRIRALPDRAAATVPIVALTADAFTDTRERCLVAGMNSFLSKPVSREKLAALVRQLFGSAGAAPVEPLEPLRHAGERDGQPAPLIDTSAVARTRELLTPARYAQVLGDFLDQAPGVVDRLRQAVRDAQPQELRLHAHATRGAALNLGLAALAATAEGLQNGAAHLPAHEVARLVQRFDEQLAATRAAARQAGLIEVGALAP